MATPAVENPATYGAAKTALLLLDFHKMLVGGIKPQEVQDAVCSRVQTLLQAARDNGSLIVHGLIGFNEEPPTKSKIRPRVESTYKPMLVSSPGQFEEWPSFSPLESKDTDKEITVTKIPGCVSALKSEKLLRFLKEQHGVESLLICGLITSGAVLSTAREAADLGFVTTVVHDGCWDHSPQAHDIVIEKVLPMTAWTVDAVTGVKLLSGKAEPVQST